MITTSYEEVQNYASQFTTAPTLLLSKIYEETWGNCPMPQMISGHLQGRVLAMFSHMIQPMYILEIGTYTGYSALSLAAGLQAGGVLHTIDNNPTHAAKVKGYLQTANKAAQLRFHLGDALAIIFTLDYQFDLVFIDADKKNYGNYYDLVLPKVREGGFILIDNVLWGGKVFDTTQQKVDKRTKAIINLNNKVHSDTGVENVLFPIRDGLMVLRKK